MKEKLCKSSLFWYNVSNKQERFECKNGTSENHLSTDRQANTGASGIGMVGDVLERAAFLTRFHDVKLAEKRSRKRIDAGAVMATFIALLCMGKPDFECVRELQNDSDEDMIALYHAHGKCEQFHSEIKTDMGVERLPSGKFVTNKLVLELTVLAYNILRMIGQEAIRQGNAPAKRIVSRKRVRTVIQNLIHFAGHVTQHARQLLLSISRSNAWADCILALAKQFCFA